MKQKRIPAWLIVSLILLVIISAALWLRIVLPFDQVFVGDRVKLTGIDAYYYMRLVDNLVSHFPTLTAFDPYMLYPGGSATGGAPDFFAYFVGAITWLLGFGKPDQHIVDVVAVYIPPVLAVITVIMVYFIGRVLVNKWMGLLSAGLLAILPGEFLSRSILGYTDHHVAEVMLSTLMMLFAFMAVKESEGGGFRAMRGKGWGGILKPVIFGVLGGICFGIYLLTWAGALLFVLLLFAFIVVQAVIEHLRGRPVDYLGILGVSIFGISLLMYLPLAKSSMTILSLGIGIVASVVLVVMSRLMVGWKVRAIYYPAAVAVLGVLGFLLVRVISPALFNAMFGSLISIFSWHLDTTVMEMQPLLIQRGNFTLIVAFGNFTLAFFFSIVATGILIYQIVQKNEANKVLLIVWSIIIFISALAMRRFAYYYAVNAALLSGYLAWLLIRWAVDQKQVIKQHVKYKGKSSRGKKKLAIAEKPVVKYNSTLIALVAVLIAATLYYPNLGPLPSGERPSIDLAKQGLFAPPEAWCESLDWLRDNSEEPFGDADAYYGLYNAPAGKNGYKYLASAYGSLSWWDYGYWITRIARRAPSSNPGSGHRGEAIYFISQDEVSAARVLGNWGARYIIVDNEIASFNGKFYALAALSGSSYHDYYDFYVQRQGEQLVPVILFYPEYYRSMVVRLYNFEGKEVIPASVDVIGFVERSGLGGQQYKEITERKIFATYSEAIKFLNEQKEKNYRIVGDDPFKSPVPLEALKHYRLIHGSDSKIQIATHSTSKVKIFEYNRDVLPLAGNWNGDRKTELGLWQPEGSYFLLDVDGDGSWDVDKGDAKLGPFGYSTDVPLAGDWSGDGRCKVGVWRPSDFCFYLDYNGNGTWDPENGDQKLGPFGFDFKDIPIVGDWSGDGRCKVGVWRPSDFCFYLDYNGNGTWDPDRDDRIVGPIGKAGDVPITGNWNGDGKDEVGIWEPDTGLFFLKSTLDGKWDSAGGDLKLGPYGTASSTPLNGKWVGETKTCCGVWDPNSRLFYLNVAGDGRWGENGSNITLNPFQGY